MVVPVVDRLRCEGKQDCVAVCPFDVFEMIQITPANAAAVGVPPSYRVKPRGEWQALVVRPEACHACNLCVVACPEDAIRLRPAVRRP